jgi:hypothetical protein
MKSLPRNTCAPRDELIEKKRKSQSGNRERFGQQTEWRDEEELRNVVVWQAEREKNQTILNAQLAIHVKQCVGLNLHAPELGRWREAVLDRGKVGIAPRRTGDENDTFDN